LESILNQTFNDFEIILCDDGSTDNTYNIALSFSKKYPDKIKLLKNEKNMGLHITLNKCLEVSSGEYIARMDGDDISLPYRFEKQVKFLDQHPEYSIVSCTMIYFDENGDWGKSNPIEKPNIKSFIKNTPFAHGASMIRKKAYEDVGGYTVHNKLIRGQDYDLWAKMYSKNHIGYNLQEPLYKMRNDINAFKRRTIKSRINSAYSMIKVFKMLKIPFIYYIYALKPIIKGILPQKVYIYLHKKKIQKRNKM